MNDNLAETVLKILNRTEDTKLNLEIEAIKNEILSYLNRNEITNEMFPVMCVVISDIILEKEKLSLNVQSLKEGDLSISYFDLNQHF